MFGKSLCINKDLPLNHIISFEDLEAKKPFGYGIAPSEYKTIIGKKLKKAMNQWEFLKPQDIRPV